MTKRRNNGPAVALGLVILCVIGFLSTVWNYSRTHPFSSSATVVETGDRAVVKAIFDAPPPPVGQRIVLKITGDSTPARGGAVVESSPDGTVLIAVDSPLDAPAGTSVTASVDGTVGPLPAK